MTAAGFSHWLVGSGERKDGGAEMKLIARSFSILENLFFPFLTFLLFCTRVKLWIKSTLSEMDGT